MSKGHNFADDHSDELNERKEKEFDRHRSQGNVLFVGNLPFQTPWQHIKDQFRQAGKVRYTDLIADRTGRPKGSALVTMQTASDATRAIDMFNETEFEGRRLIVRLFDDGPRPQLVQRENMPSYTRGRDGEPQQQVQQERRPAQQQQPQQAVSNVQNQRRAPERAVPAVAKNVKNESDFGVPKPRSQQQADRKLFVSNLPFDCTAAALRETFQQIGNVDRTEIISGRSGKSRGMGIVVMATAEEARTAISEFDGIEMAGRAMNVRFDQKS